MSVPTDVRVTWCGIEYTVGVKSDDKIGELKRKTVELTGLPSKRQKHMDLEGKELNDDHLIGSLQDPPSTDLVSLNKKVEAEPYRKHFHANKPACTVEETKDQLVDFNNSKTRLRKGKYKVGSMQIDCLTKCYFTLRVRPGLLRSIELMRGWKHSKIVVMENIYKEGKTVRLVLSNTVDGTLRGYIKAETKKENDVVSNADGTFTNFFKKMILDLCAVVDEMVKRKLCPIVISEENLYLKRMENGVPELKILFDNVEHLPEIRGKEMLTALCQQIKAICSPVSFIHKDVGTAAFCNFLGKEAVEFIGKGLAKTATHYPINWTHARKSQYLIDLIPSTDHQRKVIDGCGIVWPIDSDGNLHGELLELKILVDSENEKIRKEKQSYTDEIDRLTEEGKKIESEEQDEMTKKASLKSIEKEIEKNRKSAARVRKEITWNYNMNYGHDLVRLARNLWKHFDSFPSSIKAFFKNNKDAILDSLEIWCPGVWVLMYNVLGLG